MKLDLLVPGELLGHVNRLIDCTNLWKIDLFGDAMVHGKINARTCGRFHSMFHCFARYLPDRIGNVHTTYVVRTPEKWLGAFGPGAILSFLLISGLRPETRTVKEEKWFFR